MATRRRGGIFIALLLFVASCQEDGPQDSAVTAPSPDLFATQRADCAKEGGRWGVGGGSSVFVCYLQTPDANKQCRAASDCEGLCLARSRTCAPIKPFLGCHEVLTDTGQRATLCVN